MSSLTNQPSHHLAVVELNGKEHALLGASFPDGLSQSIQNKAEFRDRLADALKAGEGIHPLERLPCANVEAETRTTCPNDGKLSCGVCKLVSYCSKTCQQKHWPVHKRDCKDKIRSDDWKPAWVIEGRSPSFMTSGEDSLSAFNRVKEEEFAVGLHLWGGVPAVDVINLSRNENDINKNFSLAFVASGDLRNIVQTITALPSNYAGQIKILLNDREPRITIRNIALLLLLGTVDDEKTAAELALHFWYSVFLPVEHHVHLSTVMSAFLQQVGKEGHFSVPLGSLSTLSGKLSLDAFDAAAGMLTAQHQLEEAVSEYERVRFAPSRQDRHHRHYCRLEPSHRLACLEFRRFGLLLPFGALNSQFNTPNNFLFSPGGRWLQDDLADPLESWDIEAVIKAGLAHGAQRADIYGCLYFFLSDTLRSFARRLRQFRVSFHVFNQDAGELSSDIRADKLSAFGVPKTIRFDRVDVSNILDVEYAGVRGVLTDWGTLLRANKTATIVGYFMNWAARQPGSSPNTSPPYVTEQLMKRLMQDDRIPGLGRGNSMKAQKMATDLILGQLSSLTAIYENSKAFSEFLEKQGTAQALQETKLKLKGKHTIAPHRLCAPLDGQPDTLPHFPDSESWYLHVQLGRALWSERYVEFSRA
ncbi:hypothetical protein JAAARDRAFT_185086 [Jaapia argillacea MUCL 33604]|uniref:MYND-type domain-containing protein n=1 Tax=Jaapia argillacea MUCL 33604 TaxID=933084 RepID=A0A067PLJ0_9AGAM|nr:hypothetical protein JAAARDRAFT_185086 [Jaapia argillacea MUCL 33604]